MPSRPNLELTETLLVELAVARTSEQVRRHTYLDDDGTIKAFLEWQSEVGVFPVAGYGSIGPGFYRCLFRVEDAPAVRAWFKERGLPVA